MYHDRNPSLYQHGTQVNASCSKRVISGNPQKKSIIADHTQYRARTAHIIAEIENSNISRADHLKTNSYQNLPCTTHCLLNHKTLKFHSQIPTISH
ncbi:hypothetical protein MAR_001490 [Mya arenaria]|uniref:Uncharacterized protein n=1 Tax=Mya arenaria TaxID=6604 RepID=A0ABY7FDK0_MYAAR|nr:hypothetical protein MAR_001490 [Mya arenaria]